MKEINNEHVIVKKAMKVIKTRNGEVLYEPYVVIKEPILFGLITFNFVYKIEDNFINQKLCWHIWKSDIWDWVRCGDVKRATKKLDRAIENHFGRLKRKNGDKIEDVSEIEIITKTESRKRTIGKLLNK